MRSIILVLPADVSAASVPRFQGLAAAKCLLSRCARAHFCHGNRMGRTPVVHCLQDHHHRQAKCQHVFAMSQNFISY